MKIVPKEGPCLERQADGKWRYKPPIDVSIETEEEHARLEAAMKEHMAETLQKLKAAVSR